MLYRGIDATIIHNHEISPNDKMMVIFASDKEILDELSQCEVNSQWVTIWEIPEQVPDEELIKLWDKKWEDVEAWKPIVGKTIGEI